MSLLQRFLAIPQEPACLSCPLVGAKGTLSVEQAHAKCERFSDCTRQLLEEVVTCMVGCPKFPSSVKEQYMLCFALTLRTIGQSSREAEDFLVLESLHHSTVYPSPPRTADLVRRVYQEDGCEWEWLLGSVGTGMGL